MGQAIGGVEAPVPIAVVVDVVGAVALMLVIVIVVTAAIFVVLLGDPMNTYAFIDVRETKGVLQWPNTL